MKKIIRSLVGFNRRISGENLYGFVLDYNKDFTLVHSVDHNMYLDGYIVFMNKTVTSYQTSGKKIEFVRKALKAQGIKVSKSINIDLSNIVTILLDLNKKFPLLVFEREYLDNSVCYIGTIEKLTDKTVVVRLIDSFAKASGKKQLKLKDITKVSCNGNYEKCLWLLANTATKNTYQQSSQIPLPPAE